MARPGLNEERGARRAAELKARFSRVSSRALGSGTRLRVPGYGGRGRTNLTASGRALGIWLALGVAAFVVGSFLA
ncbi:hypothetical protein [Roseibium aestuarii]|uniref:Uncharacterized protein n=1 Tax=Roseibium aestuarii TaxID=2600299 RepID=A0ABW4JZ68_9HYPH|nr:hypothetical protein [Roseibium aestuarii]